MSWTIFLNDTNIVSKLDGHSLSHDKFFFNALIRNFLITVIFFVHPEFTQKREKNENKNFNRRKRRNKQNSNWGFASACCLLFCNRGALLAARIPVHTHYVTRFMYMCVDRSRSCLQDVSWCTQQILFFLVNLCV